MNKMEVWGVVGTDHLALRGKNIFPQFHGGINR
jgi:hypothetical protein